MARAARGVAAVSDFLDWYFASGNNDRGFGLLCILVGLVWVFVALVRAHRRGWMR